MITVDLIYADGSSWFAGGFNTLEDANTWIESEKTRPYWKTDTQVQLIDNNTKTEATIDVNQT